MTFFEMFTEFIERYSKKVKRSWTYDEREVNKFLPHWFKRKASTINKQEVQLLHERIRDQNGLYQASQILERISSVYNRAIEWGWQGTNPAEGVRKFQEKSRAASFNRMNFHAFFRHWKRKKTRWRGITS